jgi:vancomycin resistance protein YoaR
MRRSHTLIAAAAALIVLACAGSVFAYDASRDDTISKGVKVGIVDVGGLTAGAARAKLRAAMLAKLQRPLVVVAAETRFALSAREAHIEADIDGMVAEAVKRGRQGSIVTRTWRGLTGGEVDASITPEVVYSRRAVQRLVDKIRVKMSRKPRDADITVAGQTVEVRKSKSGLAVDTERLRAKVEQALVSDIVGERAVRADLRRIKPKITT